MPAAACRQGCILLIIGGALLAAVTDCRRQMASDCLSRPAVWAPTTLPADESVSRSKSLVDQDNITH